RWVVTWAHIVGVLCVVETEYYQMVGENERSPAIGTTHEEMVDHGWEPNHPRNWVPEVWPVLADGNDAFESGLRVAHERSGVVGEGEFPFMVGEHVAFWKHRC